MAGRTPTSPIIQVKLGLDARSPAEAISALASEFVPYLPGEQLAAAMAAVLAREAQASTFLGYETALPHARLAMGTPWLLVCGRLTSPLAWGDDTTLARFVFLTLLPPDAAAAYLALVRDLGRAVRQDAVRRGLAEARDNAAALRWLRQHLHAA